MNSLVRWQGFEADVTGFLIPVLALAVLQEYYNFCHFFIVKNSFATFTGVSINVQQYCYSLTRFQVQGLDRNSFVVLRRCGTREQYPCG
jgi:hypothetical protein